MPINPLFQAALKAEEDDHRVAEEGAAKEEAVEDNNEVIEVDDKEVEEDLRDLLVLKYTLYFRVILKREEKGVVVRYFKGTALTFTDARLFAI